MVVMVDLTLHLVRQYRGASVGLAAMARPPAEGLAVLEVLAAQAEALLR